MLIAFNVSLDFEVGDLGSGSQILLNKAKSK